MLERAGILTWVNRIVRIREPARDLFGHMTMRWRVLRTSNSYQFHDPKAAPARPDPSGSDYRPGKPDQFFSSDARPMDTGLAAALKRLGEAVNGIPLPAAGG